VTVNEGAWYNGEKALPLIVSDLFNVKVVDILNWSASITEKQTISDAIETIFGDTTILTYVENIIGGKGITNNGVDKLLDISISDIVDVMLGVNEFDVPKNMTGDAKIDYILNKTDSVRFGDFANYVYNEETKKWEKDGKTATGIVETIYNQKSSLVLYVVAVLVMPDKVIPSVENYKIGGLIKDKYNAIGKIDSTIIEEVVGEEKEYEVEGEYKAIMDDIVNITIGEIYNEWIKGGKLGTKLSTIVLDRNLGDYIYDTVRAFVFKRNDKFNLGLKDYAYTSVNADGKYDITGNLSIITEKVFNLNVKETINNLKSKEGRTELKNYFIADLLIGDLTYDVMRKFLNSKNNLGMEGMHAEEHRETNNGYALENNAATVLNLTLNINVANLIDSIKDSANGGIVGFIKNVYDGERLEDGTVVGELLIGDLVFDIMRKVLETKYNHNIGMEATFAIENRTTNNDRYYVAGNGATVLNNVLNIGIIDFINAKNKFNYVKEQFSDEVDGEILLGDIFFDVTRKLLNTKLSLGMDATLAIENREANENRYHVEGNGATVINNLFNIKFVEILDNITKPNKLYDII
jgi:hypothetical protein